MTDYTQNTTFTTKDALTTGDPNKVIYGAALDGEFGPLATAIASKANRPASAATANFAGFIDTSGNLADSGKAIPTGVVVGDSDSQTLTTKIINSASNTITINLATATVTGTTAQFNTALSDGSFATLAGTETLSAKTFTSPAINGATIDSTSTIDAITATNLVDKSAAETITGDWDFSGTVTGLTTDAAAGNFIEGCPIQVGLANASTTPTKKLEIKVSRAGTFTTYMQAILGTTNTGSARIYVNGSAVGTTRAIDEASWGGWSENVTVSAGDLIQVYVWLTSGTTQSASRLLIASDAPILGSAGGNYTMYTFPTV